MDYLARLWDEIAARPMDPMAFRFYLQPLMSMIYATIHGLKDAREHKPPYFWDIFTKPDATSGARSATGGNRSATSSFWRS